MKHSRHTTVTPIKGDVRNETAGSREQFISEQAYALYEARGRVDGHALEDWLEAEARLALAIPAATVARTARTERHEAA